MSSAHYMEDWLICATRYKGAIYLAQFDSESYLNVTRSEDEERGYFWGSKFEQYMTSSLKNGVPDTSSPVNQQEQYYVVLKGQLGRYPLVYSAEIDAFDPNVQPKQGSTNHYVELKTTKIAPFIHRNKLLHWCVQCHLSGISKVICGRRDRGGIVRNLEIIPVSEMRNRAQKFFHFGGVCNLGQQLLEFIESVATKDDPRVSYKFFFDPSKKLVTWEEASNDQNHVVLPEWFISHF